MVLVSSDSAHLNATRVKLMDQLGFYQPRRAVSVTGQITGHPVMKKKSFKELAKLIDRIELIRCDSSDDSVRRIYASQDPGAINHVIVAAVRYGCSINFYDYL